MSRFALFRDSSTGDIDDGNGNTVLGLPDPTSESDVLTVVSGIWAGAAPPGGGGGGGGIGASELIYRYTVAGSDKTSIDTGADTPDAGSNDWSGGDLLEIMMLIRTDNAGATGNCNLTVNNDSSAVYDRQNLQAINTTVSGAPNLADTKWVIAQHGSGGSSNYATPVKLVFPCYAGTAFYKLAIGQFGILDATAGNVRITSESFGYRSTSAITRFAVAATSGQKLKVGSQLLVYKRLSA